MDLITGTVGKPHIKYTASGNFRKDHRQGKLYP